MLHVDSLDLAPGLAGFFDLVLDVHEVRGVLLEVYFFGVEHVRGKEVLSWFEASLDDFDRVFSGQALLFFLLCLDEALHAVHVAALHELLHQHGSRLRGVDVLATSLILGDFHFAFRVVELLLQIVSVNLHADLLAVHLETVQQTHRILGLNGLFELNQDISFGPKSHMVTWDLNAVDGPMTLKVISDFCFVNVLHLVRVHQALDTNLAVLLLGDEVRLHFLLVVDDLLLGFGGLSGSVLGRLRSLNVDGLTHQLLAVAGQSHQNRFWGEEFNIC